MKEFDKETIIGKVRKILETDFVLDMEDVTLESTCDDLGMESLDHVEFTMDIEEDFNIDIDDDDAEKWRTVGDVVKYLDELDE